MAFGTGKAEMNVTPLIDVLLVLIIMFLIIVPMVPNGEEAEIPRESTSKSEPSDVRAIVIQLRANGGELPDVKINGEPVTWEALKPRLVDIFKERAEKVAFIKADRDMDFEKVAKAIDIAHAANVDHVGLMK